MIHRSQQKRRITYERCIVGSTVELFRCLFFFLDRVKRKESGGNSKEKGPARACRLILYLPTKAIVGKLGVEN